MAIEDHENPNSEIKPKDTRFMGDEEENRCPPWLTPLLKERFFVKCKLHGKSTKTKCKMYCLDCTNGSLCSLCLTHHTGHRTIQIRRSSHHYVIRVNEIEKYLDISNIQTYLTNGAKGVYLKERPKTKTRKEITNTCEVCNRGLVDDCVSFCSLGCKVAGTSRSFEKGVKLTVEPESRSNSSGVENNSSNLQSSSNPQSSPQLPSSSFRKRRRKGFPQRSPL